MGVRARGVDCGSGWSGVAREVSFDLLQCAAARFGQQEERDEEIEHGAGGPEEKHGGVAEVADDGKKEVGDERGDGEIEQEGDAHADGTDARGHEFGEHEPDDDAGSDGVGADEEAEQGGDEPSGDG